MLSTTATDACPVLTHGDTNASTADSAETGLASGLEGMRLLDVGSEDDLLTLPKASLPHAVLICPFQILDCEMAFTEIQAWKTHVISHFRGSPLPERAECFLCDDEFQQEKNDDPAKAWNEMLSHLAEDHYRQGQSLATVRTPFGLMRWMYSQRIISAQELRRAQLCPKPTSIEPYTMPANRRSEPTSIEPYYMLASRRSERRSQRRSERQSNRSFEFDDSQIPDRNFPPAPCGERPGRHSSGEGPSRIEIEGPNEVSRTAPLELAEDDAKIISDANTTGEGSRQSRPATCVALSLQTCSPPSVGIGDDGTSLCPPWASHALAGLCVKFLQARWTGNNTVPLSERERALWMRLSARLVRALVYECQSLQDFKGDPEVQISPHDGGTGSSASADRPAPVTGAGGKTNPRRGLQPSRQRKRPRTRKVREDGSEESDENGGARSESPESGGRKLLACPYFEKDPVRFSDANTAEPDYHNCSVCVLKQISRLKQHLNRCHSRPDFYCGRCGIVVDSDDDLDNHYQQPTACERLRSDSKSPFWDRMTSRQKDSINRKTVGRVRPGERHGWYEIYEILFPNNPLPASPYKKPIWIQAVHPFVTFAEPRLQASIAREVSRYLYVDTVSPLSDHERQSIAAAVNRVVPNVLQVVAREYIESFGHTTTSMSSPEPHVSVNMSTASAPATDTASDALHQGPFEDRVREEGMTSPPTLSQFPIAGSIDSNQCEEWGGGQTTLGPAEDLAPDDFFKDPTDTTAFAQSSDQRCPAENGCLESPMRTFAMGDNIFDDFFLESPLDVTAV